MRNRERYNGTDNYRARFRTARLAASLSQNDIAERLKVSKQAVSNWEGGTHIPSQSHLEDVCHILNLPVDELQGWRQATRKRPDGE